MGCILCVIQLPSCSSLSFFYVTMLLKSDVASNQIVKQRGCPSQPTVPRWTEWTDRTTEGLLKAQCPPRAVAVQAARLIFSRCPRRSSRGFISFSCGPSIALVTDAETRYPSQQSSRRGALSSLVSGQYQREIGEDDSLPESTRKEKGVVRQSVAICGPQRQFGQHKLGAYTIYFELPEVRENYSLSFWCGAIKLAQFCYRQKFWDHCFLLLSSIGVVHFSSLLMSQIKSIEISTKVPLDLDAETQWRNLSKKFERAIFKPLERNKFGHEKRGPNFKSTTRFFKKN